MKMITGPRAVKIMICLCLVIINGAVYYQTKDYQAVYFEEVEAAFQFRDGVTFDNLKTAFVDSLNFTQMWLPVSFLACMVSSELFGDDPGPKHLINLFLHICSTLLLFVCFVAMTGAIRPSSLIAAFFAVHPVNVESVAWLAHHDSALNLFFITFALCFYVRYVRTSSALSYALVLLMYLLALLSNARIMAFPLLLILLDFWPFSRLPDKWNGWTGKEVRAYLFQLVTSRPVKEKVPLLGIAFLYGLVMTTVKIAGPDKSLSTIHLLDLAASYFAYLKRFLLIPGIEYNRFMVPFHPSSGKIVVAAIGLFVISYIVIRLTSTSRRYLLVGWLWFLIALVPGVLVNAGKHVMITDRYAYLGVIGIFIMVAFGLHELFAGTRRKRATAFVIGVVITAVLTYAARQETKKWQSSLTLVEHTIAAAPNRVSHRKAGDVYLAGDRIDKAVGHYMKAVREEPESALLNMNIGIAFLHRGDVPGAIGYLKKSISLQPDNALIHHNLGNAFLEGGENGKAIEHFQKAIELDPAAYRTYNSLATALVEEGRISEAIACLEESLRINPGYETARYNLQQLTVY